jgi:hypothetical protein
VVVVVPVGVATGSPHLSHLSALIAVFYCTVLAEPAVAVAPFIRSAVGQGVSNYLFDRKTHAL